MSVLRTPSPAQRLLAVRAGATAWVLIALYFLAEVVTARAWPRPYEVRTNSVSNLGVTGCDGSAAQAAAARLCSPLHTVINSAFVLTGCSFSRERWACASSCHRDACAGQR